MKDVPYQLVSLFETEYYWVDQTELWIEKVRVTHIDNQGIGGGLEVAITTETSQTVKVDISEIHEELDDAIKLLRKYSKLRIERAQNKFAPAEIDTDSESQ